MIYYSYGTALLTQDEVRQTCAAERATKVLDDAARGQASTIDLVNGSFSAKSAATGPAPATEWQPIGPGKPLTLDIREVYTGRHPGGIFGGAHSMLLTSAVKSMATYEAKPKAINFLTKKTKPSSRLTRPKAGEEGTPVMFYSPATLERSLTFDLGIVFDEFPQPVFDAVGNAFKAAAGIPVFLSKSVYLLAAGEIARIAGKAGEALFDGKPAFDASESIDLALPGTVPTVAGFMLVTPPDVDQRDPAFRHNYHIANGSLVDGQGQAYSGDIPFVVIGVDGTPREDLATFTPTAASAAVLSRFFGIEDRVSMSLEPLMDALKLYNDFRYRSDLDKLDERLKKTKDGPEKVELEKQREALLKNITTELLKPRSA